MSIKWFACVNSETGDDQKRRDGALNCCKSKHTATFGDESTTPGEENSQSQARVNGCPAPRTSRADADADKEQKKQQRRVGRRASADERREAAQRNRAIERELRQTQRLEEKFTHLLILGAHVLQVRGTRTRTRQTARSEPMSQETRIEFSPSEAEVEVEWTIQDA